MKKILNNSFFKFLIVSIFYVVVNTYIYKTCLNTFSLNYKISIFISWFLTSLCTYFINTYYTFKSKPSIKTFMLYPITSFPSLIFANIFALIFLKLGLGEENLALITNILSIPFTYIVMKYILNDRQK